MTHHNEQTTNNTAKIMTRVFPLPRAHTGAQVGNGTMGLMIWGGADTLRITVGRAGFWDRGGGNAADFSDIATYAEVKRLLEAGDETGLRKAFTIPGGHTHPHLVSGGRLDLRLPAGWTLDREELELGTGRVRVYAQGSGGAGAALTIRQATHHELAWIELPEELTDSEAELIPAWDIAPHFKRYPEIPPPQRGDTLHVLPSLPARWREVSFDDVRAEGAFLIGATVSRGHVTEVRVRAESGGLLRVAHGIRGPWQAWRDSSGALRNGDSKIFAMPCVAGETWRLHA